MTLWLHARCGYPSYEQAGTKWNPSDFDGRNFAKALKGEPFKGHSTIKDINGKWRKISAENRQPAFDIFGAWGAKVLADAGIGPAYLIPVPGSKCIEFDTDAKGRRLCDAVAEHHPGGVADEAFHWIEEMTPAHKGGPRQKHLLLQKLVIWRGLPKDKPVVLIDDVATLHGHMRACIEKLREHGFTVAAALVGAQTVHDRPEHHMFSFPPFDLDAVADNPFSSIDW